MVASHGKVLKSFDQGQKPSLLLDFARRKSLIDQVSKTNLITFTRATAATYVGADGLIKTAASGEARFDHNPVTGESLGLLIEEQRANLLTYSEQFDNAAWAKFQATVTTNATTAPDGTSSADKLVENTAAGSHDVRQNYAGSISTIYTYSFFAKAAGRSVISVYIGGPNTAVNFNLLTGTIISSSVDKATIQAFPNGWYKCTLTESTTEASTSFNVILILNNGTTSFYTGDGTSGVYLWGAQLEAGFFPTSYIPTTTALATRNVDSVLIDGANFSNWYNQNEGSFFAEYQRPFDAKAVGHDNPRIFSVSQGTSTDNRITLFSFTNGAEDSEVAYIKTSGVETAGIRHPLAIGANESAKTSMSYSATLSQASSCRDGGTAINDTSVAVYTSMNRMRLGNNSSAPSGGYDVHNGTIKRLIYWPTRLDDSDLQEATR